MSLCDRLIGGAVDGLMLAIDTIASFWQTPREVEWAKAAADGLAEREAEEEVAEPGCPRCSRLKCYCHIPAEPLLPGEIRGIRSLLQETSATAPVAVDGPAEGEPPEPSAGVECCCDLPYVGHPHPCGPCRCDDHGDCSIRWYATLPSAEVEPPASAPSAESPAPEFDWVTTAIPVIAGVLAEHSPDHKALIGLGVIWCRRADNSVCSEYADWQDWRNHVAPRIATAIVTDLLSTIFEDTTFAINAFSGDRPRPLADFPKHQK